MNSRSSCFNVILTDFEVQFVQANIYNHRVTTNKLKSHLVLKLFTPSIPTDYSCSWNTGPSHSLSDFCIPIHFTCLQEIHAGRVVYFSKIKAHLVAFVLKGLAFVLKIQWRCRLNSVFCSNISFWRKLIKGRESPSKTQYQLFWERTICHLSKEK